MVLVKTEIASIISLEHSQIDNYSLKFSGSVCMHSSRGHQEFLKDHMKCHESQQTPHTLTPPPLPHTHRVREKERGATDLVKHLFQWQSFKYAVNVNRPGPVQQKQGMPSACERDFSTWKYIMWPHFYSHYISTLLCCWTHNLGTSCVWTDLPAFSAGIFSHSVFLSLF